MEWRKIDLLRRRAEPFARREFLRVQKVYSQKFFERITNAVTVDDIVYHSQREFSNQYIREGYFNVYDRVGVVFAKIGLREFKQYGFDIEKKDIADEFEYLWQKLIANFVDNECGERIAKVTRTTYDGIVNITKKQVDKGLSDNLSLNAIAKSIQAEVNKMERWRALRIARTEVVTASNEGNYIGAGASGLELIKIWNSAIDGSTREDHIEANLQEVEYDEDFEVGGEMLTVPGDPKGSERNVINCRCSAVYRRK